MDLEVTAPPPPWLPPRIKEIYVGGKKTAIAHKNTFPGIRIFSLEILQENLRRLGTPLAANERDFYFLQFQFAESDVGPSLHRGSTQNKSHRDLAEYKIGN